MCSPSYFKGLEGMVHTFFLSNLLHLAQTALSLGIVTVMKYLVSMLTFIYRGTSTSSNGQSRVAVDLTLVGLSFQVFSMVAFCALIADYMIRYYKAGGRALASIRLRLFVTFLGLAILLILARCAYRVAELSEGYQGDLIHDEPLFIGLEGVLIAVAVLALCIGHPGFVFLPSEKGLKISRKVREEDGIMLQSE